VLQALTVDAAGDVAVAGSRIGCASSRDYTGRDFTVAKLAGTDGSEVWRRSYTGDHPKFFSAADLAATAGGDIVAAGSVTGGPSPLRQYHQFAVLGFSGASGALEVCGDGYVDPGEECDDGNTRDEDCCSSVCRAAPDRPPCSEASQACLAHLPFACLTPTVSDGARIRIDARTRTLGWAWASGAATNMADFGDPRHSTGYAVCVFGDRPDTPLVAAVANFGRSCAGNRGCWRRSKKGFRYRSSSRRPDGLSAITLRAGGAGKARIDVRAKGNKLTMPALPLTAPVVVELRKLDGSPPCWGAEHSTVEKNTARHFVARGD
jgi:cysteine-rich repeat protein